MLIEISTDGACAPNPGTGGWAAVFRIPKKTKVIYGWEPASTNARMEITAAIMALEHLSHGNSDLIIYCDSSYVVNGITSWIVKWKRNKYDGIKNPELWQRLDSATKRHKSIKWKLVKGHATHKDNILCDEFAVRARELRKSGEELL